MKAQEIAIWVLFCNHTQASNTNDSLGCTCDAGEEGKLLTENQKTLDVDFPLNKFQNDVRCTKRQNINISLSFQGI
jgi:hypothetical protein